MSAVVENRSRPMNLNVLLGGIAEAPALAVSDITLDSRRVRTGGVFFALSGTRSHGLDYLDVAIARGAVAVVWESGGDVRAPVSHGIPMIPVPGLREHMGIIADRWFGAPSERLRVYGVTGTNGKTTVAWLLAGALERLGQRCAYLGTLGSGLPGELHEAELTTPDVIEVHRSLAGFVSLDARAAALEVSSHALDQGRTDGVRLRAAGFTNLSRDHLDYHGDMQSYGEAKARLLTAPGLGHRAINVDDAFGAELFRRHAGAALGVSVTGQCMPGRLLRVSDLALTGRGIAFRFEAPQGSGTIDSALLGRFNADNLALALGLLLETGIEPADAAAALGEAVAPPGRMQAVGDGSPMVIVDYAHTPAALGAAIEALRPHCRGRLWCVFGCGGERDAGKRPLMGEAAGLADRLVITDDNPRGEDPEAIAREILAGVSNRDAASVIRGRSAAIATAIGEAADEDCVLIAGKGHERFQLVAGERRAFSDAAEAEAALARRFP